MNRINNFDAVRIIAALVVIFGHAHPLSAHPDPTIFGNGVQGVAVKVFFVVSGFLVARSWESDPHAGRYLLRRGLRLVPGLALILALTVLLLGPALTALPLSQYFADGATWRYFVHNLVLQPAYSLPGVFADNAYPFAVNGSLWSLPAEVLMYLILPFVMITTIIDRSRWLFVIVTVTMAVAALIYLQRVPPEGQFVVWGTGSRSVADVGPYFFIGALYAVTPMKNWLNAPVAILLLGLVAFFQVQSNLLQQIGLMIALPYAVLAFATQATPVLSRLGRFGDPSYGVYLYGFPIQQTLFHFWPSMGPIDNAIPSAVLALLFGFASWHLIEKRALAYKPYKKPKILEGTTES